MLYVRAINLSLHDGWFSQPLSPLPLHLWLPQRIEEWKKKILFAPQFAEYCSADIVPLSSLNLIESLGCPRDGRPFSWTNSSTSQESGLASLDFSLPYHMLDIVYFVLLAYYIPPSTLWGESIIPAVHCVQKAKTNIQSEGLIPRWVKVKVLW